MASKLKTVRDQITTDWEALTPPSNPARTYAKLTGKEVLDGASGHRLFYFLPPTSAVISEFATGFSLYRYEFEGRLRLSMAGEGIDGAFDDIADESILLVNRTNDRAIWPAGVRLVRCDGYTVDDADSDDFEIIFPLIAEVEES